jgi:hypothetical protein
MQQQGHVSASPLSAASRETTTPDRDASHEPVILWPCALATGDYLKLQMLAFRVILVMTGPTRSVVSC